jgi:hypothetical protein
MPRDLYLSQLADLTDVVGSEVLLSPSIGPASETIFLLASGTDAQVDGAREVTTADVLHRVRSIRPTWEVKREEIEKLRRWAREHLAIDAVHGQPAAAGERLMEF